MTFFMRPPADFFAALLLLADNCWSAPSPDSDNRLSAVLSSQPNSTWPLVFRPTELVGNALLPLFTFPHKENR